MSQTGVAIVGASHRSTMMFRYLNENPSMGYIRGVYDIIPQRAQAAIDMFEKKDAVVYETLDQVMDDDKVQAVFVGTSDFAHAEPAVKAANAGKHVYLEKPLATTLEDCNAIVDAAEKTDSVFYLGMNLRHGPVHEKLHEITSSGKIGRITTIEANTYYFGGRTYFRRWNRLRKYGGGLWVTKGCHDFDLLNWFAQGQPTRVAAFSSLSYYKPWAEAGMQCRDCPVSDRCPDFYDINAPENERKDKLQQVSEKFTSEPRDLCLFNSDKDTFDNGIAIVEYDSDVRATYTMNVVSARQGRQMRLMGTEGAAEGDMDGGIVRYWERYNGEEPQETFDLREQMNSGHGGSDQGILGHFFHCCKTGEQPKSNCNDGRLSVQVALAARESCDQKNMVELSEITANA